MLVKLGQFHNLKEIEQTNNSKEALRLAESQFGAYEGLQSLTKKIDIYFVALHRNTGFMGYFFNFSDW